MSEIINWSGYDWLTRERWGSIHPEKSYNWYDPSAIKIVNGQLKVNIHNKPRTFLINGKEVLSQFGTGLITCETDFGFGKFEIEAKLPSGRGLWPAFWMYATDCWPPEIDIFEGYSGEKGNYYNNFLKPVNIQNCIHIRDEWNINPINAYTPWFFQFMKRPDLSFHRYSCTWTKDNLEFFIDGRKIRAINDKNLLDHLSNYKMRVIINNHIDGGYLTNWNIEIPFIINYFKYEKY